MRRKRSAPNSRAARRRERLSKRTIRQPRWSWSSRPKSSSASRAAGEMPRCCMRARAWAVRRGTGAPPIVPALLAGSHGRHCGPAQAHGVSYHSGIIPGMNLTMDRTERFYKIDQLLQNRPTVPIREFLDALGVSLATFKRDLEYMRDRLNAPIVWDRDSNGYRFEQAKGAGARYELPGLWFNP